MAIIDSMRKRLPCLKKKEHEAAPTEDKEAEANLNGDTDEGGDAARPNSGRAVWDSPTEFLLTCIGYSVGLGNVWRFPYLAYKNGGGAFMIPYLIMICLIGMPLLFMEYSFGQYFGIGSLSIFKKVCPMFQGIGIGYCVLNGLVCIYYNVIIAISLYYLFASFTSDLPWASCGHEWNTDQCGDPVRPTNGTYASNISVVTVNGTWSNGTWSNGTWFNETSLDGPVANRTSPSEEYFKYRLLGESSEFDVQNLGEVRWELCLCLLLAWILVVLFVSRGIKSTGKVAYFTATFPYVMLTVLVIRGVTLPGATDGILYFIKPDWARMADPEIWFSAATQLFYSTNLAWGGMITMASYNEFSHNCYRDAIMINIVSFCTSLYAGFAVFSIIGYMAKEYGQNIEDVIKSGPGLAFIAYPRALSLMPLAPMWSALFFFMLFLLGIGSQMVLIETVVTGFVDEFPRLGLNPYIRLLTTVGVAITFFLCGIPSTTQMVQVETIMTGISDRFPVIALNWKVRLLATIFMCSGCFLLGIPCVTQMVGTETVMSGILDEFPRLRPYRLAVLSVLAAIQFLCGIPQVTQGGMYVLQLMDHYSAGFCVLIIAIVECVVINWIYRNDRFASNVKEMLGKLPHIWWRICWRFISIILILAILIFSLVQYTPAKYGEYLYPWWADGIGWCMTMSSVLPIFVVAIYKYIVAKGDTAREKWLFATRPVSDLESKEEQVRHLDSISHNTKMDMMTGPAGEPEKAELKEGLLQQSTTVEINSDGNHTIADNKV